MTTKRALIAAFAVGLMTGFAGIETAQAAEASARMLANTCNGCHGPDGSSYGPAGPSIAGMNDFYLMESMVAYRSGDRPSTIMGRIAKGYTDSELKKIARFFSKKTLVRHDQPVRKGLVGRGQEITRELCQDCHEKDGYAAEDYPILAGQMIPYLRNNLADFKSGWRSLDNNPNLSAKERRKKKRKLNDLYENYGANAAEAVVNFYGSRK